MRYLVVVEPGRVGWGAHVPDVPGCVAAADSRDEVIELIHDALARHILETVLSAARATDRVGARAR